MKSNVRQQASGGPVFQSLNREELRRCSAGLAFPFIQQAMQGPGDPVDLPPPAGPTIAG
jgi:hypothetical protein